MIQGNAGRMAAGDIDRSALTRVLGIMNGKGGVGKTSTATCISGLAAAAGYQVLLVDMDVQGNAAEDLGYADRSDDGASMLTALIAGTAPVVVKDVRRRLDVICGGTMLAGVDAALAAVASRFGDVAAQLRFAQVLSLVAGDYDLVVVDCPPNKRGVALLSGMQFVLAPTKSDAASIKGLRLLANDFMDARQLNPGLELLGVILFGATPGASRVEAAARDDVEAALEGAAPMMLTTVRHVEAVAREVRDSGLLPHELDRSDLDLGELRGMKPLRGRESTSNLSGDYQALVAEVMQAFNARVTQIEAAA